MGKRFWLLLRRYCLESTIVGLKYFYIYPDFLSRCFWTLNMIAVLVMSCMITWLLYGRFAEMPTRITIENQFEPVINLPYPTVTLCSPNQMTMSSMEYFNRSLVDGHMTIDLQRALPMLLGFYELVDEINEDDLRQLQHILELNRYTIVEVMGKMPLSCERFLRRCILGGKLFDCNYLFKPIITAHGYCCAFNSKYIFNGKMIQIDHHFKNHTVNAIGLNSALTVIADYQPDDAILGTILNAGAIRESAFTDYMIYIFNVMLTDWTEFPSDYATYLVDTNGEAFMFLRAIYTYCSDEVELLPASSRDCFFENEHRLPLFRYYKNSDCDHLCVVLAVFNTCHCWLYFLPYVKGEHVCKSTDIPCIIDVKKNMSAWLATDLCKCPRDCVYRQYHADLTIGNFDALPYLIKSQNPFGGMKINTSTTRMSFLFLSSVYVKQKQETVMSIISLVSNLGGVFGLFMGCSGISVLEIFFYIYIGVKDYIRCRFQKRGRNAVGHHG